MKLRRSFTSGIFFFAFCYTGAADHFRGCCTPRIWLTLSIWVLAAAGENGSMGRGILGICFLKVYCSFSYSASNSTDVGNVDTPE
jgi:hypothetical protein